MKQRVLIISSDLTGHGHKSITDALVEQFLEYEEFEVRVVDGFLLGGEALLKMGKLYGPVTRKSPLLWKYIWHLSASQSIFINQLIQRDIEEHFLQLVNEIKPHLIVTTHPNFNGSVLNILEKHDIFIPFVTLIADLVTISPFWMDERADFIICPTMEAKNRCLDWGISSKKLKVYGFPIRAKFFQQEDALVPHAPTALRCLLMSGGEGIGNMEKLARLLIEEYNAKVTILAGRNQTLKRKLETSLYPYLRDNVTVLGFKENVEEYMKSADILLTRGSPNTLMEAIACNLPIIVTGALPGQEKENPQFITLHQVGFHCPTDEEIRKIMNEIIITKGQTLLRTKRKQREFFRPHSAEQIVSFLSNIQGTNRINIEEYYEINPIITE